MLESIKLLAVILVALASFGVLLTKDWRATILSLAIQFSGVFLLIAPVWPLAMAITILIAGWLAGVILGMSVISLPRQTASTRRLNPFFNLLAALLIYLTVLSLAPQLQKLLALTAPEQSLAGLTLIGLSLLRLALDPHPLTTSAALLALLAGFTVIFASLTATQFAAGALAMVILCVALAGSYLLLAPQMEESA